MDTPIRCLDDFNIFIQKFKIKRYLILADPKTNSVIVHLSTNNTLLYFIRLEVEQLATPGIRWYFRKLPWYKCWIKFYQIEFISE